MMNSIFPVTGRLKLLWLRYKLSTVNSQCPADQMRELVFGIDKIERKLHART